MENLVRIGCGAGFAGDRADASAAVIAELARCSGPRFLMFETLAERTLALCQLERRRDAARGFGAALERMLPQALGPCLANGPDRRQFRWRQSARGGRADRRARPRGRLPRREDRRHRGR